MSIEPHWIPLIIAALGIFGLGCYLLGFLEAASMALGKNDKR